MGTAWTRPRWGLKSKLTISILVVGALPLVVGMVLAFIQGSRELRELSGASFAGIASETARKLDLDFSGEIARTHQIASDPLIVGSLEERSLLRKTAQQREAADPELIQAVTEGKLAKRLKQYYTGQQGEVAQSTLEPMRASTRSLYLTDSTGRLAASISPNAPSSSADQAWWKWTYGPGKGQPFFENVYFDSRLGVYAFSLSMPVIDKTGTKTVGVLHRIFDAKEYLDPSIFPIRFGKTGHVMLIDSEGIVMSCPILPTGAHLNDKDLIRLVTRPQAGWVQASSNGHGSQTMSIIGFSPLSVTSRMTQRSTGKAWHTFVWQSSDELFAPTQNLFKRIFVLGVVGIGLLGTMAYVAAARIVKPIRRLQKGAMLIGQGALHEPIHVKTGDEIEQLADEFNRMHTRLQQTFSGLEHTVRERTMEVRFLQEYNEQILQSVPNPIILFDLDERIDYVNRAARQALDLPDEDLSERHLFDLVPVDESSRKKLREEIQKHLKTRDFKSEPIRRPLSGQVKDPLAHPAAPDKDQTKLRRELLIGRVTYQYELFHIGPQFGKREQIGLVLRDTTEEGRLQDQMVQTERLASLEILTSGIGHELNNPLFGIVSMGESILDENDIPQLKEHAKRILLHAKRMAGIIQDFSGQVYPGSGDLHVKVDINQQLDQALKMLGLTGTVEGLEVQKNYQPLPKTRARPDEMVQVFLNIIKNAIQAMKGKGVVQLATDVAEGRIRVSIGNSGPAIPREFLPRIFDPFFTTKGPGQGIGLGLTIARRIVLHYGGRIDVETDERKGTTFILSFPASESDS